MESYGDHRMAMALAVVALAASGPVLIRGGSAWTSPTPRSGLTWSVWLPAAPGSSEALDAQLRGDRLSHSPLHQPPLPAAGLRPPGAGRQLPSPTRPRPRPLAPFFASLRAGGWLGCNVTIPHKQAVFDLVDAVSEEASLIGAVNTVVCEPGGRLSGHNTDAPGFCGP